MSILWRWQSWVIPLQGGHQVGSGEYGELRKIVMEGMDKKAKHLKINCLPAPTDDQTKICDWMVQEMKDQRVEEIYKKSSNPSLSFLLYRRKPKTWSKASYIVNMPSLPNYFDPSLVMIISSKISFGFALYLLLLSMSMRICPPIQLHPLYWVWNPSEPRPDSEILFAFCNFLQKIIYRV